MVIIFSDCQVQKKRQGASKIVKYRVFNVEFDGIDKSGKDSIMKQIFSYAPNKYIPKARGLLSQIAYSKLFNRDAEYLFTEGYVQNTLFVYLTVDEDDWNVRCDLSHEHELNKSRSDVESEIKYKSSTQAFDYAYELLKSKMPQYSDHFMTFNTSQTTPIQIIKQVAAKLEQLNN